MLYNNITHITNKCFLLNIHWHLTENSFLFSFYLKARSTVCRNNVLVKRNWQNCNIASYCLLREHLWRKALFLLVYFTSERSMSICEIPTKSATLRNSFIIKRHKVEPWCFRVPYNLSQCYENQTLQKIGVKHNLYIFHMYFFFSYMKLPHLYCFCLQYCTVLCRQMPYSQTLQYCRMHAVLFLRSFTNWSHASCSFEKNNPCIAMGHYKYMYTVIEFCVILSIFCNLR